MGQATDMDETAELWTERCTDKKKTAPKPRQDAAKAERSAAAREQSKIRNDAREAKKQKSSGT